MGSAASSSRRTAAVCSATTAPGPDINNRIGDHDAEILNDRHRGALIRCPGRYERSKQHYTEKTH
jgi:hypothetical protein